MTLQAGDRLGPYEILESVGRGGMGVVYKAYDPALNRMVAVKVLPTEFLHDSSFAERFQREVRIWASIDHPSVVPVYMAGIENERPFLSMKFVAGGTLADRLRAGPLTFERAFAFLADVAVALDHAHSLGIVHRDVKPANVLLGEEGRAYLSDFGIARIVSGDRPTTHPGGVAGTPRYMAPEQARSQTPDHRADIYSLGCMAYEMLTGVPPFTGETPLDVMMRHITEPPISPRALAPDLSTVAEAAILKAMAKEPAQRWPAATLFVQGLTGDLDSSADQTVSLPGYRAPTAAVRPVGTPRLWRVPRRLAAALLGGLVLGAGLLAALQRYTASLAAPVVTSTDSPPEALMTASLRALERGAYPEALQMAELTLKLYPRHAPAVALLDRVRRAWEAEKVLGLWPDAMPAPSSSPFPR